ncbi:putative clathrin coat assembly protein [Trypanosoma theileri]|uniref:Putative clathrin coat assembly protein n=1 Tax=Trypanosoma theileri TaxID=67003 RepID=A0A1X0NIY0_9TRYP|nr:putative clathrin coat assembly protein [Trypanosoma theileri]ORC84626.1 putative clathrin coat assembly protein [Trypanosoma theileri]
MNERDTNELKRGGGYLKEKAIIGLSIVTGDELDRAIMKTTSHMLKAPKEKHMQRLLAATYGHYKSNSRDGKSICDYIVSELEKRLHTHNWIVVLKALVTLHRLMTDGSNELIDSIQRNRSLFCARNTKDLSENVEGSIQSAFIRQYFRYLEERASSQQSIGNTNRIESVEFSSYLRSLDVDSLAPIFQVLLTQLASLLEIDYRETIVDNFCTLEAYQKLVDDGKILYQLLSDRIIFILDGFSDFPLEKKKYWLQLYKEYNIIAERLRFFYNSILDSSKVFAQPPPRLKPLPASLLEQLEDDVRMSNIACEDVTETLESLGITRGEEKEEVPSKEVAKRPPSPLSPKTTEVASGVEQTSLPLTAVENKCPTFSMDDLFVGPSVPIPSETVPCAPTNALFNDPQQLFMNTNQGINQMMPAPVNNQAPVYGTLDDGWSTGAPVSYEGIPSVQPQLPPQVTMTTNFEWGGNNSSVNQETPEKKKDDAFKDLYVEGQKGWYSKDK